MAHRIRTEGGFANCGKFVNINLTIRLFGDRGERSSISAVGFNSVAGHTETEEEEEEEACKLWNNNRDS